MHKLIFLFLFFSLPLIANDQFAYITVDQDTLSKHKEMFGGRLDILDVQDGIGLLKVDEDALGWIGLSMHRDFNRCGGYILHDDLESAQKMFHQSGLRKWAKESSLEDYSINAQEYVGPLLSSVKDAPIQEMISKLSEYHNRYYKSESGVESSNWIGQKWRELTKHRSDAQVEFYEHRDWPQPTPILTIKGQSSETIIIGGHADSIAGFWGGARSRAPGADDNASGISTITEVIRVLVENGYRPQKTLKFMAYAAEEVGLRGSSEIARNFAENAEQVIGVLQLDMTNYNGGDWDIVLMNDYTNREQNAFIGALIDTYLPELSWGYDRCGYACSDHASWHNNGFPASMPFEAKSREKNPHIHSSRDTLDRMGGVATHAAKFAKLALAFIAELDN